MTQSTLKTSDVSKPSLVGSEPLLPNPAVMSMTGYASATGAGHGHSWTWELRSVNGKGFDLRLRLPDIAGLEAMARAAFVGQVARGSVTLSLKLARDESASALGLNTDALEAALAALVDIESRAHASGIMLTAPTAVDLMGIRGVMSHAGEGAVNDEASRDLLKALTDQLPGLIRDFNVMRAAEGAALAEMITGHITQIADLRARAIDAAAARAPQVRANMDAALRRLADNTDGFAPDRLVQELALLAIKTDVTEEIDRLGAHVTAARALLNDPGPNGRKLDFLSQEFIREANTLCSKANDADLTAIGLDLKAVIDQMREQIQNVE